MNYYEILGVDPQCPPEEIKMAYRRKAQKAHPDKGGDPKEFHAITKAYETLSDPGRRAHYDEHGEDAPPDQKQTMVNSLIAQTLFQVIDTSDVERTNIIAVCIQKLEEQIPMVKQKLREFDQLIHNRERAVKRLGKSGNSLAKTMIETDLSKKRLERKNGEAALEAVIGAVAVLKEHTYEADLITPTNDPQELLNRYYADLRGRSIWG